MRQWSRIGVSSETPSRLELDSEILGFELLGLVESEEDLLDTPQFQKLLT